MGKQLVYLGAGAGATTEAVTLAALKAEVVHVEVHPVDDPTLGPLHVSATWNYL